jgi:hypothetical protein
VRGLEAHTGHLSPRRQGNEKGAGREFRLSGGAEEAKILGHLDVRLAIASFVQTSPALTPPMPSPAKTSPVTSQPISCFICFIALLLVQTRKIFLH